MFMIFIASHISNIKRLSFLKESLYSLFNQTMREYTIHLSISFETEILRETFISKIVNDEMIVNKQTTFFYYIRNKKTPQMRHFQLLSKEIESKYDTTSTQPKWVLFCDDDDTYHPDRLHVFLSKINECYTSMDKNAIDRNYLVGIYESIFGKNHKEQRHEYWCYCLLYTYFVEFLNKIEPYEDIIDNICCDILLGEYLRRTRNQRLFSRIEQPLYNYRRDETNNDSVTGDITDKQTKIHIANPPDKDDVAIIDYILTWNEYLNENLHIYLHDTFLKTVIGWDLENILKSEFRYDYPYLEYVDCKHIEEIQKYHFYLLNICKTMYDIPF